MRARHGKGRGGAAGLTLLELLVAITLLGFLSALIAGGVRFGLRAWEQGARDAAAMEIGGQVEALMRRQLAGLAPRTLRGSGREVVVAFWGDTQSLRFVGRMPAIAETLGDMVMEYALEDDGQGSRDLVLRWQPMGSSRDPAVDAPDMAQVPILSRVREVRFAYFGEGRWQDRWRGRQSPPRLIRITIVPEDAQAWTVPPFLIRVETETRDP
ncbi:MAG: hypothetical protein ACFB6R_06820 [Alphaproteobacteria bacterium]